MSTVYTTEEIARLLAPILARYNADSASVFGSYARGKATGDSDLDIIVHGGSRFSKTDIFAIAEDLHNASGKRVDVYEESEIIPGTDFYRSVFNDAKALA